MALNSKEDFVLLHPVQNPPDEDQRRAAVEQGLIAGQKWQENAGSEKLKSHLSVELERSI